MEEKACISPEWEGLSRRDFLKVSGMLGMMGAACGIAIPAAAEVVRFNRSLYKVTKTRPAMGTFVSITILHESQAHGEEAVEKAFDEVDRLTRMVSRYDHTTELAALNREGYMKEPHPEFRDILDRAMFYHHITHGAFDISVVPLVDLLKKSFSKGSSGPPSSNDIRKALQRVDARQIQVEEDAVRFLKPQMAITLDGIAKGYIVDRACDVLARHEVDNFLVNGGGDIRTAGHAQEGKPWTVAIQDPNKKAKYPDIVRMTNGAIATSGSYEVYFDRERVFHHIVNPSTGQSPRFSVSVSVVASSTMEADALSTAAFVMSPEEGVRFMDRLPGCECLIVTQDSRKMASRGWKGSPDRG